MKRTYKIAEIAGKIGKPRATVVEWSNHFCEFLPTISIGGYLRYTEEAIEIFQIISNFKDANKPIKFIKEHLQEIRQKAIIVLNMEEPDSNLPLAVNNSTSPSAVNNSNLQISKETMELRNMVQLLKQKIEENKAPMEEKDHIDDLNQLVSISSLLSPSLDHSNSQFVQLTNEVTELSNIIQSLTQKVFEVSEQAMIGERLAAIVESLDNRYNSVSEEVTELHKFQQDIRSEVAAQIELLNSKIESVFVEVTKLQNVIQTVQQKVTEVSEQDFKGELLTATTELLNHRYENVAEDIKELGNVVQLYTEKVTEVLEQEIRSEMNATAGSLGKRYNAISEELAELRSVIQILIKKVAELFEQDISSEVAATIELLQIQFEGVSVEVKVLQNVIQTVQQKVNEASEQDFKGEILTTITELLNHRYKDVSEEVNELRNTTAESMDKRYDEISQQLTSQQRLLDKIAKFLGFQ